MNGMVYSYNESAKNILGLRKEDVIGSYAKDLFPEIPYDFVLKTSKPVKEKLIRINNNDIVITVVPIINFNTLYGAVASIKKFSDTEKKLHKLRTQLIGKGHRAKYSFYDIKGTSLAIKKCKEIAHKGTLFLDEIGEMPVKLQARLLRVLQEREVMRIGGDRVINIDVRIIAANNRDFKQLVEDGNFRTDLYYRFNVLPLRILPLRERKEDICIVLEEFKAEYIYVLKKLEESYVNESRIGRRSIAELARKEGMFLTDFKTSGFMLKDRNQRFFYRNMTVKKKNIENT